jgi:hypothetical protein
LDVEISSSSDQHPDNISQAIYRSPDESSKTLIQRAARKEKKERNKNKTSKRAFE